MPDRAAEVEFVERDDPARSDKPRQPPDNHRRIGEMHQHHAADECVHRLLQRQIGKVSGHEPHIRQAGGALGRESDRVGRPVHPDHRTCRANQTGGQERHVAAPATGIQNGHALPKSGRLQELNGQMVEFGTGKVEVVLGKARPLHRVNPVGRARSPGPRSASCPDRRRTPAAFPPRSDRRDASVRRLPGWWRGPERPRFPYRS